MVNGAPSISLLYCVSDVDKIVTVMLKIIIADLGKNWALVICFRWVGLLILEFVHQAKYSSLTGKAEKARTSPSFPIHPYPTLRSTLLRTGRKHTLKRSDLFVFCKMNLQIKYK